MKLEPHVGDVTHSFVVGPTGQGMSAFLDKAHADYVARGGRPFLFDAGLSFEEVADKVIAAQQPEKT